MAIQDAIASNREIRLLNPRQEATHQLVIANRSQNFIATVGHELFAKGSYPALMIGLNAGEQAMSLDSGEAMTSAVFSHNDQFGLDCICG